MGSILQSSNLSTIRVLSYAFHFIHCRYETGDDKEELQKDTCTATEEEEVMMKTPFEYVQ